MTISEMINALTNTMNTYGDIEVVAFDSYIANEGWDNEGMPVMPLDNDNVRVINNTLVVGADEYDIL